MTHRNLSGHLLRSCGALALVALMSACSSGSTSTGPGAPLTVEEQRTTITGAIAAARAAVAKVKDDSGDAVVTSAAAAVAAARKAIAEAEGVPAAEKAAHTATLDQVAESFATARKSRMTSMRAESNAVPLLVADAITKHGANVGGFPYGDKIKRGSLKIEVDEDGVTTIGLGRAGATNPRDIDPDQDLLEAMVATAPEGWTARRFELENQEGVIFTDRRTPPVEVRTYSWADLFKPSEGATSGVEGRSTSGPGSRNSSLHVFRDGTLFFLDGSGTPTRTAFNDLGRQRLASDIEVSFLPDQPETGTTAVTVSRGEYAGSYLGVPGNFECRQSRGCEFTRHADGTFDVSPQSFYFKPTLAAGQTFEDLTATVRFEERDQHLWFGYWMTTQETDGKPSRRIHTFGGEEGYYAELLDRLALNLERTATYSGDAAGIYVHRAGRGDAEVVSDGEFIASAALRAVFDVGPTGAHDPSIPASDHFRLTGEISDFKSVTGNHDLSDWTLKLLRSDTDMRGNLSNVRGKTSGGQGTPQGAYAVRFIGNADFGSPGSVGCHGSEGTGCNTDYTDDHPEAAIGAFNGYFDNGHVAGAFGVKKDDD